MHWNRQGVGWEGLESRIGYWDSSDLWWDQRGILACNRTIGEPKETKGINWALKSSFSYKQRWGLIGAN